MWKRVIGLSTGAMLLFGGAAWAHGHAEGHPGVGGPGHAVVQPVPPGAQIAASAKAKDGARSDEPVSLRGFVPGVVTAVSASSITVQGPAAGFPAHLAAVTTGGAQIDVTLPLAANALSAASAQGAHLAVGEHVQVLISSGVVTAVVIDGAGGVGNQPPPVRTPPAPSGATTSLNRVAAALASRWTVCRAPGPARLACRPKKGRPDR